MKMILIIQRFIIYINRNMKQVSRSRNAFNVQEMTRMVRNKNWGLKTCFAIKQKVTTNIKKRKKSCQGLIFLSLLVMLVICVYLFHLDLLFPSINVKLHQQSNNFQKSFSICQANLQIIFPGNRNILQNSCAVRLTCVEPYGGILWLSG